MKSKKWLTMLAASVLFAGCARVRVSSQIDPDYSFSQVETYQWIDAPATLMKKDEAYLDLQLQQALNNELAAKGWNQVLEAANTAIQVAYCIIVESHIEYTGNAPDHEIELSGRLVFDHRDRTWNYKEPAPDQIEYMVETGTIHCLINDAASGKQVWHGMVETEIDRSLSPEKRREHYQQIARILFRELP